MKLHLQLDHLFVLPLRDSMLAADRKFYSMGDEDYEGDFIVSD